MHFVGLRLGEKMKTDWVGLHLEFGWVGIVVMMRHELTSNGLLDEITTKLKTGRDWCSDECRSSVCYISRRCYS